MKAALQTAVEVLPIGVLTPSPTNPRKHFDPKSMDELQISLKQHGVLQPLLVRAIDMRTFKGHIEPPDAQLYEIIDGERRYRNAVILAFRELPVHVIDASDDQVREMQVVMNLQRQDVHPLDEADGYAELQQRLGSTTEIAARVGKDVAYVTGRLKLRTLSDLSRQAFTDHLLTLDHALLMAKLGAVEQEKALRFAIDKRATKRQKTEDLIVEAAKDIKEGTKWGAYWEPASVMELKGFIEDEIDLELKKAPWDLADPDLVPSAGACTTCPSNTAANSALFGDLAIEKATCTDSICFNAKRQRFVELKLATTKEAGADAVKLSWRQSSAKPKWAKDDSGPDPNTTFKQGQWKEAKKGECPNVITGITVDYDPYGASGKPGQKKLVCVAAGCKTHKKDYEKSASQRSSGGRSSYDPEAERQKQEDQRRKAEAETEFRVQHAKAAVAKISKLTPQLIRELAIRAVRDYEQDHIVAIVGKGYTKKLTALKTDSAEFARIAFTDLIEHLIDVDTWAVGNIPKTRVEFFEKLKTFTGYVPPAEKPAVKAKPAKKGKR